MQALRETLSCPSHQARSVSWFIAVLALAFAGETFAWASADATHAAATKAALNQERLGLFAGSDFRLTTGRCPDCLTAKAALWYFQNETIAVQKNGSPSDSSPVWVGSPFILEHGRLSADGISLRGGEGTVYRFSLVPKLAANRCYYDQSSSRFFQQWSLRVRGTIVEQVGEAPMFLARTIWPEDYRIEPNTLSPDPLQKEETPASLIVAERGGAESRFSWRLLWERQSDQPRAFADKTVLGFILNGAQGDDDEAHGGHFAVVTGRLGSNGEMADWTVNNFYDLDHESEKGILPATTPMDNYLMDLNSGQAYYRPSYLLVAVLSRERAARWVQDAMMPTYRRFYTHRLVYDHAKTNCVGISLDVLRALGWRIPLRGPTGYPTAVGAFLYGSVRDRSLAGGKKLFDYLSEEQTRLLPRVGFEAIGEDLLAMLEGSLERGGELSEFELMLKDDVEAVLFVRIPQIPSSRAFGRDPVASFDDYRRRVPADRAEWKVVPVQARSLPSDLWEHDGEEGRRTWVTVAVASAALTIFSIFVVGMYCRGRLQRPADGSTLPCDRP